MRIAASAFLLLFVIQSPALPEKADPSVIFTGAALAEDNLSAVLIAGEIALLADDENGLLIGQRRGEGTYHFGPPTTLDRSIKGELDLEALTRSGEFFFALGSHGRVRKSIAAQTRTAEQNISRQREVEDQPSRQWLFRFKIDREAGGVAPDSVTAVSLRPILEKDPILKLFLPVPSKENGIDIEGLAADGENLFVAFRGPVLRHGFVPVLQVTGFPNLQATRRLMVRLDGLGIRDLIKVSDGFLVLAGPVGDGDQPHRLYRWDGRDCTFDKGTSPCSVRMLKELPAIGEGRAEGIAVLSETSASYEILTVYDGVAGGSPTVLVVPRVSS